MKKSVKNRFIAAIEDALKISKPRKKALMLAALAHDVQIRPRSSKMENVIFPATIFGMIAGMILAGPLPVVGIPLGLAAIASMTISIVRDNRDKRERKTLKEKCEAELDAMDPATAKTARNIVFAISSSLKQKMNNAAAKTAYTKLSAQEKKNDRKHNPT